jgi:flagellar assembly protein FliH
MSSSSEGAAGVLPAVLPDLRTGVWTRLGDDRVLGDAVTEEALGALAERTRDAARAQGYATGWSQGRREAQDQAAVTGAQAAERAAAHERRREEEHRAAVAALARASEELLARVQEVCDQVAAQATDLALEVTRALVGHELAVSADPGADVVRRVLADLPADPLVQVRLHPGLAASPAVTELTDRGLTVVPDPTLEAGDAVVETDEAAVDLRLSTALDRLAEVLR